jgi:tetratricopeptide (TPR) repeat protein
MKRFFAIFLLLAFFSAVGCAATSEQKQKKKETNWRIKNNLKDKGAIDGLSETQWQENARKLLEAENHKLAIKALSNAIKINPGNPYNYAFRAAMYCELFLSVEALEDYEKALVLDPQSAIIYSEMGALFSSIHGFTIGKNNSRWEDIDSRLHYAIKNYSAAIALVPNRPEPYLGRGAAYERLHKYDEALANFNKSVELFPEAEFPLSSLSDFEVRLYSNRGDLYLKQKNYQKAIEDFNKVLLLRKDEYLYMKRGTAYKESGAYMEAISDYTKAIELASSFKESFYLERAKCYEEAQMFAEAVSDYEQCSNFPEAKNGRARCLKQIQQ